MPAEETGPRAEAGRREDRRGFLYTILGTGFFGLAIAVLYPTLRFIFPPRNIRVAEQAVSAGNVDDFPPNSGVLFWFGE